MSTVSAPTPVATAATPAKSLLITGASSGIGRATALAAAAAGWRVIACGRDPVRLAELAATHSGIETRAFDLTDLAACHAALGTTVVDVAILNAGHCEYVDMDAFDPALFRRVFEANFFSAVNTVAALLPGLRPGARLLVVDSLARLLPFTRSEAYGASKAALFHFAKGLEVDLHARGIRVQTVSPGFVRTPLTDRNRFSMPLRIEPEQAAAAILALLQSGERTGYFPFVFASLIRVLSALPHGWQAAICRSLARRERSAA
jgi:NAD(P)-dependent dehydrogenase (short-subunit alcohol dehydrogenase family)